MRCAGCLPTRSGTPEAERVAKPVIERAGGLRLSKFSGGGVGEGGGGEDEGPFIDDTISRPPRAAGWRFRPLSEIDALPAPAWLLQRYVPEDALMMIYGAPNSFKSFLALDWAMTISSGRGWLGAKVSAARRCCYIMGEGLRGLRQRTDAWKAARGTSGEIFFLERPVSILEPGNVKKLKAELRRLAPAFLVVDTVARNFGAGDENSTKDMTAFVTACDELRASVEAMTLCLVHHTGWSDDHAHRPRGSIALHAATDLEYLCIRPRGELTMTLRQPRTKDGEEMADEHFTMLKTGNSLTLARLEGADPRTRARRAENAQADVARGERLAKREQFLTRRKKGSTPKEPREPT